MKKNLIIPFLYMALGATLVLAAIGAKSLVQNQSINNNPTDTKDVSHKQQTTEGPSPTELVTQKTEPTSIITQKQTPNTFLSQRIKEIDSRLAELELKKIEAKKVYDESIQQLQSGDRPAGYSPSNTITAMALAKSIYDDKIKTYQEELNQLNAEKTQIMLKM